MQAVNIMITLLIPIMIALLVPIAYSIRIVWIYRPSGICPVQAEGYFMGKYFYFRSRWGMASIEFADSLLDWKNCRITKRYVLFEDRKMGAGWMPKWMAHICIYKGVLMYLLNFKSSYENR
jgi:hypothetical protein